MDADFLLRSATAKKLYRCVQDLPIIDYHNHLSIADVAENKRFTDVYELWIQPDPYKHRAMRMCGVAEKYITGETSNEEKFVKWCETLPKLYLNPLSHWSMMELERVFGIAELPNEKNAKRIYRECNAYLQTHEITANGLLRAFHVEYACPCASVIDDIALFENNACVAPSLRGDDIVAPPITFLKKLGEWTRIEIRTLKDFEKAIEKRLLDFKRSGCIFTDHALDNGFRYYADDGRNGERFQTLLQGDISQFAWQNLQSYILTFLGELYAKHGFIMQLHIGAQRYTSTKLRKAAGKAGGFAAIGRVDVDELTRFLDAIDGKDYGLPKSVLFTLNPADNALISVLSGSFSKDGASGLITQGPAWWWCDHKLGIIEMLENTSAFSVLSNFLGMTTDSRSFLSFVRHDYFRRIVCNWLGEKWENGELLCPNEDLQELAYALCYGNAKKSIEK